MCQVMKGGARSLRRKILPTRTSNVPCHTNLDTETVSQMLISYKERTDTRKLKETRGDYNDWVWQKVIDLSHKIFRKMKGKFHHEITTDGMAVSILLSRRALEKRIRLAPTRVSAIEESESPRS